MLQNKRHIFLLTGSGNYEKPQATIGLSDMLSSKGIPHHLDVWGHDMPHDWPTWRSMMTHYVGAHL
jgi:esterase/lipase superfamily enzyme